jgi:crossover junction endodeoxyribonuclease RusA
LSERKERVRSYWIALPVGMKLLNENDRDHRLKKAAAVRQIRHEAFEAAKTKRIPRLGRVRIRAVYHAPDNRRRDFNTGNWIPSIKPAIDGLVDAGVLADDSDKYVIGMELTRGAGIVKGGQLVIEIEEVDEASD